MDIVAENKQGFLNLCSGYFVNTLYEENVLYNITLSLKSEFLLIKEHLWVFYFENAVKKGLYVI